MSYANRNHKGYMTPKSKDHVIIHCYILLVLAATHKHVLINNKSRACTRWSIRWQKNGPSRPWHSPVLKRLRIVDHHFPFNSTPHLIKKTTQTPSPLPLLPYLEDRVTTSQSKTTQHIQTYKSLCTMYKPLQHHISELSCFGWGRKLPFSNPFLTME